MILFLEYFNVFKNESVAISYQRMNGMSINELCCLFCCPPIPSIIVSKLAFLPPTATYKFVIDEHIEQSNSLAQINELDSSNVNRSEKSTTSATFKCNNLFYCTKNKPKPQMNLVYINTKLQLNEKAEWQYGNKELEKLETFLCRTEKGHKVACLFVRCCNTPKYTILFSHGNAVDIGQMSSFYYGLGLRLECNIFTYDYSGYGASDGKTSEKNLYSDIETAWNALRARYGMIEI